MAERDGQDRGDATRLLDAIAGGRRAFAADQATAGQIELNYPGVTELVRRCFAFHRKGAAWAVTEVEFCPPAQSVIFTATGLPPRDRPLHEAAARLRPAARFAYVNASATTTLINRAVLELPEPGRVRAFEGDTEDPESWITTTAKDLLDAGPVSVHICLAVNRWPAWLAVQVLTAYRRLLPPGSTVCLSVGSATGPRAAEFETYMSGKLGRLYTHVPEQLAGWIEFSGLRMHPWGVRDVRPDGRGGGPAARVSDVARILSVVALVP